MKTAEEYTNFVLDNYEILAAIAWGGYKYSRSRGFVITTIGDPETFLKATYIPIGTLDEVKLPPALANHLRANVAIYNPKKDIVVLVIDAPEYYSAPITYPILTPSAAYRKHRAFVDRHVVTSHAGLSPAAGARLN